MSAITFQDRHIANATEQDLEPAGPVIPVLDNHGYIQLIEAYGRDERIIEAARMSTGKGFKGWGPGPCPDCGGGGVMRSTNEEDDAVEQCSLCHGSGRVPGDEKLLRFLYEHAHHTPFEMAGAIIEVQAPIMVFREWHRHRTQSYNEMSARYIPLPDVNYLPSIARCLMVSTANKQAGRAAGAGELTHTQVIDWMVRLESVYTYAQSVYQQGLDVGIPKELARLSVPVGRYTRMRAAANLRNWLAFMTLRCDENAQWEIRQYANALAGILFERFPRTLTLWAEQHIPGFKRTVYV